MVMGASVGALLLAFLCTLAGISIAEDTINNTNIPFVNALGASVSGFFLLILLALGGWVEFILFYYLLNSFNRCFCHSN